eukprot:TRINITY_DN29411_c0_g1_i1.p1 TRINITY_DN29411_c0_g1~~TRINITY_DN29411_c0_g1_i1.p1  ORF type:complete len:191 (+),score=45.34 TRINITY_DN29411_c0_g1_i1:104-676(+)
MAFEITAKLLVQIAFWYYVATIVVGAIIGAYFLFSQSDEEAKSSPKTEEWGRFKKEVANTSKDGEGSSGGAREEKEKEDGEGEEGDAAEGLKKSATRDDTVPLEEKASADKAKKKGFTVEEVSRHSSRDDCWLIIKGKVYDVTSYVDEHPGGDSIAKNAGGEATEGFLGPQHPSRVFDIIEDYFVGDLVT